MKQLCSLLKKNGTGWVKCTSDLYYERDCHLLEDFTVETRKIRSKMLNNMVICVFYGGCNITAGEPWDVSSEPMAS